MLKYLRKIGILLSIGLAVYVVMLLIRDLPSVYFNAFAHSDSNIYAFLFVAFIAMSGISALVIPLLLYKSANNFWLLPFVIHLVIVVPSDPVYVFSAYLMVWSITSSVKAKTRLQ